MELRSLKYFQAVYDQGSISAAAKVCFVSQPSITAAIQQLEALLSITLFIRHARGVLPTSAADKLYPLAKDISEHTHSIYHLFSDAPKPVSLRLGIMRSLGAKRMSFFIKQIAEKIKDLELTLVDPEEPCDIRVVLAHSVTNQERFVPIWQDDYQLAIPMSWPMADQKVVKVVELDAMPFIHRVPCDALNKLKEAMANHAVHFQHRANIRTIEYAWQLVSTGIGAALLPNWQEIKETEGMTLLPIEDLNLVKHIGLAYKANKENTPLIVAVKEVCENRVY
ncbi:LysR family transcriptional regulator [Shewanella surugensis]|uniref:LysR family transcriptional regulator n=1 Tax=Shewanella surugensis TaxID=212020 RepID=A0ABT0L9X4_9GAMM|nr:LysR family transcriptional regulator [Shewanella surugensis]MCL1124518.1 LysR family transcriptional regulator [Shewanella surugensis]